MTRIEVLETLGLLAVLTTAAVCAREEIGHQNCTNFKESISDDWQKIHQSQEVSKYSDYTWKLNVQTLTDINGRKLGKKGVNLKQMISSQNLDISEGSDKYRSAKDRMSSESEGLKSTTKVQASPPFWTKPYTHFTRPWTPVWTPTWTLPPFHVTGPAYFSADSVHGRKHR